MLSGEYRHTVDAKNRTFLPAKLREKLGDTVIVAKGIDKCVSVYSVEGWQKFEAQIETLPPIKARAVRRWIYAFSVETPIDAQGRMAIPQNLREYAGISKNIVSIGVGDHAEMWDENEYTSMVGALSAENVEATLIEMGM